jgi:hypothetical protein
MCIPVDLYAQLSLRAIEIGDETAEEDMLAADVDAELMVPKALPEACLRGRERMT